MRKRILITGASGFVGRQVLRALENEYIDIACKLTENTEILNDTRLKQRKSVGHHLHQFRVIEILIIVVWFMQNSLCPKCSLQNSHISGPCISP